MLTYAMDERRSEPIYEYLYRKIREDILSGTIAKGEALPSKRALAKHLNISIITVENAYAQLMTEGYIYSVPRSGFYASDVSDALHELDAAVGTGREEQKTQNRKKAGISDRKAPPEGSQKIFADFSSNQTQPDKFPFTIWAKLSREVLSSSKEQLMTNPPTGGVWELREAITDHLKAFRGLQVLREQVILGAGTEYLYGLLIQLLGLDRVYAVENPGYRKVALVCESHGVRVRHIPMDESGLSVKALEASDAGVVHVTPAHHFPTGITMPAGRRYELLRWAAEKEGRYIIEDDYDSEFRLSGRPLPALLGMDSADKVIYMNTFTKTLASTMRISYMILPLPLLAAFRKKLRFYACTVPTFEQYTLALFIKQGYFEKHINRMRTLSRKKRDLLLTCMQESKLGEIASVAEEHAGLHFLLKLKTHIPEEQFLEKLREKGILLARFEDYNFQQNRSFAKGAAGGRPEPGQEDYTYVMNYSSVPLERIPEAVRRICLVLEDCER